MPNNSILKGYKKGLTFLINYLNLRPRIPNSIKKLLHASITSVALKASFLDLTAKWLA